VTPTTEQGLRARIQELEGRLETADQTLYALRTGGLDALVGKGPDGDRVYPLNGDDEHWHLLKAVINGARDYVIFMLDPAGLVLTWNEGAERLMGYVEDEVLGQNSSKFYAPEALDAGLPENELRIARATGRFEDEGWRVRRDGSRFWATIAITPINDNRGNLRGFSSLTRDTTERRRAEERFQLVVEAAASAMIMVGADGLMYLVNTQTEALFGYNRQELLGQPIEMLLPERFRRHHGGYMSGFFAAPSARAMGACPIELGLNPIDTVDGQFVLASIIDITERERADAALREAGRLLEIRLADLAVANRELAHKNEEVEAFVYIISHDLRTPLLNLQGFSKELEISCQELGQELGIDNWADQATRPLALPPSSNTRVENILKEDIPSSVRYISASAAKLHRLINALLEFSRYGRQEYQSDEVELRAVIQSTLDLVRLSLADSGVLVSVGPLPRVYGDATALGQLFANLIGNAIKYRQPGRPGLIEIGGEVADGDAHCWVRDNGAGFPASAKSRLFQIFQRFHPGLSEGEGMGLAIVKRVVERHGGRIWVESEEGLGATFHFTLPCVPVTHPVPDPASLGPQPISPP
jgi:PAS domain S-box-containing protein